MDRIRLCEEVEVSRIVHGQWRLNKWGLDKQGILSEIEQCLALGVTTFDHADIYGDYTCESLFGAALAMKPELRAKIRIVTKCGIKLLSKNRPEHALKYYDTGKEHIVRSVERSLVNFHTDHIDLLLIHRPDPLMDPAEVAEAFLCLKREGKVLSFGVSNFKASQVNMLSAYLEFPLVTNQIEISPLYLEHFGNGVIDQCLERRIPPMAWSPLAGGKILTAEDEKPTRLRQTLEKIQEEIGAASMGQVVYAWLLSHPSKIIPIVGSHEISRIKEAVDALQFKLTRQQWFEIWQSATGRPVD